MPLTEEQKTTIQEEKEYRAQVRNNAPAAPAKKKSLSCGGCLIAGIAIIFVIAIVGAIASPKPSSTSANSSTATPTPTPISDSQRQALAQAYCDNHAKTWRLPDYTSDGMPPLQNKDEYSRELKGGSALTLADCRQVIDVLISKMNLDYQTISDIANRKYWTDMLPYQAALSIGVPDQINDSGTSSSVEQQWVYEYANAHNSYLYFHGKDKDNLTLTSWQNF